MNKSSILRCLLLITLVFCFLLSCTSVLSESVNRKTIIVYATAEEEDSPRYVDLLLNLQKSIEKLSAAGKNVTFVNEADVVYDDSSDYWVVYYLMDKDVLEFPDNANIKGVFIINSAIMPHEKVLDKDFDYWTETLTEFVAKGIPVYNCITYVENGMNHPYSVINYNTFLKLDELAASAESGIVKVDSFDPFESLVKNTIESVYSISKNGESSGYLYAFVAAYPFNAEYAASTNALNVLIELISKE